MKDFAASALVELAGIASDQAQNQAEVVYQAEQPLALHLLNNKRQRLLEMEQSFGIHIDILVKFPEAL